MAIVPQGQLADPDYQGPAWHKTVLEQLTTRLKKPTGFPCTFGINAYARSLISFIFVESLDEDGLRQCAADMRDFVQLSREWDGRINTASPLVMAFSTDAASADTVDGYHKLGWKVLQYWHDVDDMDWPENVSTDPHSPFWTMCFDGMQIFINMSNPAHEKRRSRNLGDHMTFIINPRERFDLIAGENPEGKRVRDAIRKRIDAYDDESHCPQLSSYLAGDLEWWQYGITDSNQERPDKCPFHFKGKQRQAS